MIKKATFWSSLDAIKVFLPIHENHSKDPGYNFLDLFDFNPNQHLYHDLPHTVVVLRGLGLEMVRLTIAHLGTPF